MFGLQFGHALGFDLFAADPQFFEEPGGEAVGAGGIVRGEFGAGGESSVAGVGDDLFDDEIFVLAPGLVGFVGREVERGDLEAVEEESGAAGVDGVGRDATENLTDGELDGSAILGEGEIEGGLARAAGARAGDGLAGGVVEVAELFPAEGGAAAAAAFGVDVAALEALRRGVDDVGHAWGPHPLVSVQNIQKKGPELVPRGSGRLRCENPAYAGPSRMSSSSLAGQEGNYATGCCRRPRP